MKEEQELTEESKIFLDYLKDKDSKDIWPFDPSYFAAMYYFRDPDYTTPMIMRDMFMSPNERYEIILLSIIIFKL